jgi:DNA-binding winged helix-turn-helix (wHTH) protein
MLYRFEGCSLDLTRGCLEAAGREVELRPKCFDLLRHLLENGNRLISKEELVAAAWPQAVVTDESLARCISDVRAAIADHEHKII